MRAMTRRSRAAAAAAAAAAAKCGTGAGDESHGGGDTMTLRRKQGDESSRALQGDGLSVDDNKGGDLLEYDPEPIFRRMGTLNCKERGCPDFGGRCPLHGKERLTCRVKGCDRFDQKHGLCVKHLCVKHLSADKGVNKVPVKKKKEKIPAARGTDQSKGGKGEAGEPPLSTPVSTNEKQASAVVAPETDKDVVISMYNSGKGVVWATER